MVPVPLITFLTFGLNRFFTSFTIVSVRLSILDLSPVSFSASDIKRRSLSVSSLMISITISCPYSDITAFISSFSRSISTLGILLYNTFLSISPSFRAENPVESDIFCQNRGFISHILVFPSLVQPYR